MKITGATPLNGTSQTMSTDQLALKKACGEFESLLLSQMLQKMRSTVQKTDLFGSSEKEEMFQSMLDDEVAKNIAHTGSLGIADVLYTQLSRQQSAKVPAEAVDK